MSAAPETTTAEHGTGGAEATHHPTARDYVNVAVLLAVLTALEVMTYFFELPQWAFIGGLTALAIGKFATVVGYYMHLKFDSRIFRRMFVFGLMLAISVFLLVLAIMFFGPGFVEA